MSANLGQHSFDIAEHLIDLATLFTISLRVLLLLLGSLSEVAGLDVFLQ